MLQQENALLQVLIAWTKQDGSRFEPAPDQPIATAVADLTGDIFQTNHPDSNSWLTLNAQIRQRR